MTKDRTYAASTPNSQHRGDPLRLRRRSRRRRDRRGAHRRRRRSVLPGRASTALPGSSTPVARLRASGSWCTNNEPGTRLSGISVTLAFKADDLNRNLLHLQYERNGGWRGVGTRTPGRTHRRHESAELGLLPAQQHQPGPAVSVHLPAVVRRRRSPTAPLIVWLYGGAERAREPECAGRPVPVVAGRHRRSDDAEARRRRRHPRRLRARRSPTTPTAGERSQDPARSAAVTRRAPADDGGSDMTWLAYTIGALLLLGGVGVDRHACCGGAVRSRWRPIGRTRRTRARPAAIRSLRHIRSRRRCSSRGRRAVATPPTTMPMPPATSGGRHSAPTSHVPGSAGSVR